MRKLQLFFAILVSLCVRAQVNDSFSDGNFTSSPPWLGHTQNFVVSPDFQLQSKATATSVSWLSTTSLSINNASWQCTFKINYPTSSSNYACFYLVADSETLADNTNGYYVQVGGTNDEVSLFYQQEKVKSKIIDGFDKRTDGNLVEITVKVLRDKLGNFSLHSKKSSETDFVKEGECFHEGQKSSNFVGLLFSNTSTTGAAYFFDDVVVTGNAELDTISPQLTKFELLSDSKIRLQFSEKISINKAHFTVDNSVGKPLLLQLDTTKRLIDLDFGSKFERSMLYTISYSDVADLAGNVCKPSTYQFGLVERAIEGDVVINEIMFDAPLGGQEYVELMNISNKLIDASQLSITTRKADGSLNAGIASTSSFFMLPGATVAWALNPDSVRNYHRTPTDANFSKVDKWNSLNNESASLVISNIAKDTVYDELQYSSKWHHVLLAETKGIALERISPNGATQNMNNWHSAASTVNYGTPGYENSQYYKNTDAIKENIVWLEPKSFSPNNDGVDDICFIHYSTEYSGFMSNVRVFNPSGVLIAELAKNMLLSAVGYVTWDGKTAKGLVAETGIYVLYFEMFNAATGKKVEKKMPIVVTGR